MTAPPRCSRIHLGFQATTSARGSSCSTWPATTISQEEMVAALQRAEGGSDRPETGLERDRIFAQLDPSATGVATYRYDFSKNLENGDDGTRIDALPGQRYLPETNTGNVEALRQFIEWARRHEPARKPRITAIC